MSLIPWFKDHMKHSFSTLTNIAYLVIGILVWAESIPVAISFMVLGVASTGFHWVRTKAWHTFDIVAIFYAFGAIAGHLWFTHWGVLAGLIIALMMHLNYGRFNSKAGIATLGLLCLVPFAAANPFTDLYYVVGCFAFALITGQLGETRLAEQNGIVYDTLHGVCHLFSALGMYYLITL